MLEAEERSAVSNPTKCRVKPSTFRCWSPTDTEVAGLKPELRRTAYAVQSIILLLSHIIEVKPNAAASDADVRA